MKLLTTLTIFYSAFILSIEGEEECATNADACNADSAFITIACSLTPTATCTITAGDSEPEVIADITEIRAPLCKTKCEEQQAKAEADGLGADQCAYYRWEETGEGTSCYMMTECQTLPCEGDCCSGGQIGCTEPGQHMTCGGKIDYDSKKVHIECGTFPNKDLINIYVDEEIPGGTICKTTRKCDEWDDVDETDAIYYRTLAVKCNSADGMWNLVAGTGSALATTDMINDVGGNRKLVEQPCNSKCGDLELIKENLDKPGTDLFCEQELGGDDKSTLKDGNSCILLCDNHLTMSISCQFTQEADGSKKWQAVGARSERNLVEPADVICWHY